MKYFLIGLIVLFFIVSLAGHSTPDDETITTTLYFTIWDYIYSDVSYGDNIEAIWCLPETEYSKNVSVEGQNSTNPAFYVNNSGELRNRTAEKLYGYLSENTQDGFNFKCSLNNTPINTVILNSSGKIIGNVTIHTGEREGVYCWCDFDNPSGYYDGEIDFTFGV